MNQLRDMIAVRRLFRSGRRYLGFYVPLLALGAVAIPEQPITVGPNVQVSTSHDAYSYNEVRIAADPFDAKHLIACSTQSSNTNADSGTVVFVSDDRGASWRRTLEVATNGASDEECEFGNHGDAYFVTGDYEDSTDMSTIRENVYWSGDAGNTWQQRPSLPFIDREQMAVDRTDGKWRDTLYILGLGWGEVSPTTGPLIHSSASTVYRSRDRGRFFNFTQVLRSDPKEGILHTHPVVLSDGTLVFLTRRNESTLMVYASRDNGRSFSRVSVQVSGVGRTPELTVARDDLFKDRLYAVYCGAQTPYLIISDTGGKTWSVPLAIEPSIGPCLMPQVAVNRFGIVGISWYSGKPGHRYNVSSNGSEDGSIFNERTDLDVRFTASFDGGKTVLPSMIINPIRNPKPLQIRPYIQFFFSPARSKFVWDFMTPKGLGETAGITADAYGSFHADWIDYRTGTGQVWTTRIDVSGTVASVRTDIVEASSAPPPATEMIPRPGADLTLSEDAPQTESSTAQPSAKDVTTNYKAHMLRLAYDKKSGIFEADIQLEGPVDQLKRGVYFQAELVPQSRSNATFLNADNGLPSTGARWFFTKSPEPKSAATYGRAKSQIRHIRVRVPPDGTSDEFQEGAEFHLKVLLPER